MVITFAKKPFSREESLGRLDEVVRDWFTRNFKELTPPQQYSFKLISEDKNVLITSPTGTGKCVTPDTEILVKMNGRVSLVSGKELIEIAKKNGKLIHNFNEKEKLFYLPNLRAFSLSENFQVSSAPCTIFIQKYEGNVLEIETEGGKKISVTPNHPLLREREDGKFEWVPAEKLAVGMKIGAVKEINFSSAKIKLNPEKALKKLRDNARILITAGRWKKLCKLTNGFRNLELLSPKSLEEIRVGCKIKYQDIVRKLGICRTTVWRLIHQKTKYKLHDFIKFLSTKARERKFERNEVVGQEKNLRFFSFKYPTSIDENLIKWIAFVLAGGHIHKSKEGCSLMVSQKENKKLLKIFLKITEKIFGIKFNRKNEIDWTINSTPFVSFLIEYLKLFPGKHRNAKIPSWLLSLDKRKIATFLKWIISLDGEVRKNSIYITQSNKSFINLLTYLLLKFGIFSCCSIVYKSATNTPRKIKRKYYQLRIYGVHNLKKLFKKTNLEIRRNTFLKFLRKAKRSGQQVDKFSFSLKEFAKIRHHLNLGWYEFEKEFGNIYEVVRRSGHITRDALNRLINKLERKNCPESLIKKFRIYAKLPIVPVKIKLIRERKYKGELIDLCVPGYENFIGGFGGIYLHNTLAGFLSIISKLFVLAKKRKLKDSIYCLYVSPLKALLNDVEKNLLIPLREIRKIAKEKGVEIPEIRIAVRSGDVPPYKKQKMLKLPPHILVTTPETLAIALNSPKFSQFLKTIRWIIVDELHELANNKRGVLLSLAIERLVESVRKKVVRIGLGATLFPLEEAAKFLVGYDNRGRLRNCIIVDVTWEKPLDLKVISPVKDIVRTPADACNLALYETLDRLIKTHRTTLIFTNTRSGTERVVYNLKERYHYTDEQIAAHHGSLSREIRLDVENRLKRGLLKSVISSTSLELGIDIGYIDLVVQIGSPKSVTRAVQRIGRSGHGFYDIAVGRVIVLDRDDLVECSVMLKCAKERLLDRFEVVKNALDILAQHVVGMALTKKWKVDEALKVIRRSYCYHELGKKQFIDLLHYLAGHYASLEDRAVYGKIWFDEKDEVFGRRGKYTRIIYFLNVGAIPDEVDIDVYTYDGRYVGSIEEEFLARLRKGDIFVLGGKPYRFRFARGLRCYVDPVPPETNPTIPSWFSELLPLSYDLALEIQKFREKMADFFVRGVGKEKVIGWLMKNLPIDENAANSIYSYFQEQWLYAHKIPGREILIEKTFDLEGRKYLIFHALFGRRINDALSRAAAIIASDLIKGSVGISICDNGFALLIPREKEVDIKKLMDKLITCDLVGLLKDNIRRTELMKRRFRHCASRSFLVLRNYKGYKISVGKQQRNSEILIGVCERISKNFPVIAETYREILNDTMDLPRAQEVLSAIKEKKLKYEVIETDLPSPFSHGLIVLGEADIITMEDRKKRLLRLYDAVMKRISS